MMLSSNVALLAMALVCQRCGQLENDFYRAEIDVEPRFTRTLPNRRLTFKVTVTNHSRGGWSSREPFPVRLSYHLAGRADDGRRIERFDNERTLLPAFVEPGARWSAEIETAGSYELEFDLVHECRTWFREQGGRTATAQVTVST